MQLLDAHALQLKLDRSLEPRYQTLRRTRLSLRRLNARAVGSHGFTPILKSERATRVVCTVKSGSAVRSGLPRGTNNDGRSGDGFARILDTSRCSLQPIETPARGHGTASSPMRQILIADFHVVIHTRLSDYIGPSRRGTGKQEVDSEL